MEAEISASGLIMLIRPPLPDLLPLARVDHPATMRRPRPGRAGARMPAIALAGNRVAFVMRSMPWASTLHLRPSPDTRLSFWDIQPQFSRDGTQLVFSSSAFGDALDIWHAFRQ